MKRQLISSGSPFESIVEVSRFIDPDWRVEIEADAVVASQRP